MTPDTFPRFAELPAELRDMIWEYALPAEPVKSLLFLYKPGNWSRRLSLEHYMYSAHSFGKMYCNPTQISVPLFFVNHEARNIARRWMDKCDVRVRFDRDTQSLVTISPFLAPYDTLYVSLHGWTDFLQESRALSRQIHYGARRANINWKIQRLAVPLSIVEQHRNSLMKALRLWPAIKTLYVVANEDPELFFADGGDQRVQPRWELEKTEWVMLWESNEFCWEVNRNTLWRDEYDPVSELMMDVSAQLEPELSEWESKHKMSRRLCLRKVYVIKNTE